MSTKSLGFRLKKPTKKRFNRQEDGCRLGDLCDVAGERKKFFQSARERRR